MIRKAILFLSLAITVLTFMQSVEIRSENNKLVFRVNWNS